jgi:polysaccharide biosynthesis protein PslH
MKLLFLSRWYPYPADNGSKIRVSNLLSALCGQHDVTLISFFDPVRDRTDRSDTSLVPSEIHVRPYRDFQRDSARALLGYFSGTPRSIVDTYDPEMASLIRGTVARNRFDLVIASQTQMAAYHDCFAGVPAIFEEVELGAYYPLPTRRVLSRLRQQLTWAKHSRFIARMVEKFRACTVASEPERQLLAHAAPEFRSVHVVPNSIDLQQFETVREDRCSGSLIFAGSLRYAPNYDAMDWFTRDIFPSIRDSFPGVSLTITGDSGMRPLSDTRNVVLTGAVRDVAPLIAASALAVVPLRSGGGTRLKVLESFALRTPVIATSKAVEGLDVRDGKQLLIADDAPAFVRAVHDLIQQPDRASELAENAFSLVQARYDWRQLRPQFKQIVEQAAVC